MAKKDKSKPIDRDKVLDYISVGFECRQEFEPLLGDCIEEAYFENVHGKHGSVKGCFVHVLNVAKEESHIPKGVRKFKDLSENCIFVILVNFIKKEMKCGSLTNKLIRHFEGSPAFLEKYKFEYRFKGRESYSFLRCFPSLILQLLPKVGMESKKELYVTFHRLLLLRKLASFSVRIEDITAEDVLEMRKVGRQLFEVSCLKCFSVSPTLWTFCNVAPVHCKKSIEKFGLGLGVHTMEGSEQKHQMIKKYAAQTTYQNRWTMIFRHEFIQCVTLKEEGQDLKHYYKKSKQYVPVAVDGQCKSCYLALFEGLCKICDSPQMKLLLEELSALHVKYS